MNALGALILLITLSIIAFAPARWSLIGMMAGVLYLTQSQNLNILGINVYAVRFVSLVGFVRVMVRKEFSFSRLNGLERTLILLYLFNTVVFMLRGTDGPAYQIGAAVDTYLCYFAFRGLIGGVENFRWFLRTLLLLLAPYVMLLLFESVTRQNLFSFVGANLSAGENWVRNGRIRCFGSFRNPSLLGTLGASFLPLYIGLWFNRADRRFATVGVCLSAFIVWLSNSGGPANFAIITIVGWFFWKLRTKMQLVRRALFGLFVLAALLIKAPIWYLPAKVSSLSGGDGWHRSYLMDVAFRNLDKWWLAGMAMRETSDWFPYTLSSDTADITNIYIAFGISGGLGAVALFIILLVRAFKSLGRSLSSLREHGSQKETEFLLWGLGAMLVGHIFNWIGITYFDQTYVIWYLQLAAISTLSEECSWQNSVARVDEAYETPTEESDSPPVSIDAIAS